MKFSVNRDQILPGLQIVNTVIERRHALPILSNLLLNADNNKITFTGTDMEVELITTIKQGVKEKAEFTLPGRKILDICRTLPEGANIEISLEKDQAVLRSGKSRFTLATQPAKEFPSTEITTPIADFHIEQEALKSLLEDTLFAMAQQDVRYYLNGLLLEISKNTIRAVATDGHRLALKEAPATLEVAEKIQAIIPRKGVIELARLLNNNKEPAHILLTTNHIRIHLEETQFTSKLIDGRFPDYERVLPKDTNTPLQANREALKQGLTRASILSNEKYKGVRIILKKDCLKALAHNPEHEEAEEEIEVSYAGPEIEIGFNVSYLLDAINAIKTENVVFIASDADSSCLLIPEENSHSKYVIMPMRL
jgi:DNA polymerase III, beta subunit